MDCVAKDRRVFGLTGDWSTLALDSVNWYSTVYHRYFQRAHLISIVRVGMRSILIGPL